MLEIFTLCLWGPVWPSLTTRLGAPAHSFKVSLPRVQLLSLCAVRILLNSAIFLYTAGPATFRPLTAALDSSYFGRVRVNSLNSAMKIFITEEQLLPPRREYGSLEWESGLLTNQLVTNRLVGS